MGQRGVNVCWDREIGNPLAIYQSSLCDGADIDNPFQYFLSHLGLGDSINNLMMDGLAPRLILLF